MDKSEKLWGGRFEENTNELVEQFSESVSYDWKLYQYDIEGSVVHAQMLEKIGVLTEEECEKIVNGLEEIKNEIEEKGSDFFDYKLEDVHMNIESALIEKIGDIGRKLHTARSRNDQVCLDVRMWLKEAVDVLLRNITLLQKSFVDLAEKNIKVIIPEYTHLQHAQPVLLAHHLLAYVEMLERDIERLEDCKKRTITMPLGSGACVGTSIPIDREFIKERLGFFALTENSVDAVSDRDFIIEFLSCLSIIAMHLSRLSQEFVLWSSSEFGYINLPDAYCTGSSMMPQKKNPDTLELIRGKTGSIYGALMAVLTTMKGLSLSYNRDMQEDKKELIIATNEIMISLRLLGELVPLVGINEDRCLEHANKGFMYATDMAEYLVKKNTPFREAHNIIGKIISYCVKEDKDVSKIKLSELKKYSDLFEKDIYEAITLKNCIESKDIIGGTATSQVTKQIEKWKHVLV
jgi:argininosuccinate lyase